MKRCFALLLALLLAALPALADEQLDADRQLVEALFAAAAGTTADAEKTARAGMTDEETAARTQALADYRRLSEVWLTAALAPDPEPDAAPAPTATPAPEETPAPTLDEAFYALSEHEIGRAYLSLLSAQDAAGCLEETRTAVNRWLDTIDADALTEMNADYACWLYAPDTPIDYPVVHGEDNDYYLHRLFNGEHNACGTLFIDYRNLGDFQDPNTLLYGHHMRNGSMFKAITYYADQAYFDSHPFMLIVTPEKRYVLELLAGYTTSKRDHCYDIAISDESDMAAFVEEARAKSNFLSAVEVRPGDHLVTLSTCAYAFENARYIAIGRLNEVEPLAVPIEE